MKTLKLTSIMAALLLTSACSNMERLSRIGGPSLSPIENPVEDPQYKPVRMPMPAPQTAERQPNSLWQQGARAFFRDQRASRVGDILTVEINIQDNAKLENGTTRTSTGNNSGGVTSAMGLQNGFDDFFPAGFDPLNLVEAESNSTMTGDGEIERKETVRLKVAAVVTQVLPNGNLALQGRQEVMVNKEMRELYVSGVIRPEDISSSNDVQYDQIAEARILYGGRGTISDVQHPRYGQELFDAIMPF